MRKNYNHLIKSGIFAAVFLLFSINLIAQTEKADKIDQLLQSYTEYKQFNGSALVAENGEVILKNGYGLANMEWDVPNTANTKFRLGSITKQFTSMVIMQLAEEGKLELNAPVTTYLKNYPKATGDKITIHQLLTHTAGVPNYTSFPGFMQSRSKMPFSVKELTATFADSSLVFNPGENFSYSNSGYVLLGAIIEEITGKSYEQVVQERIFDPLQMNDSGYDHSDEIIRNRAAGYDQRGNKFRNTGYLDMSVPYAAGSLYSTVEDLYKWNNALLENKLISNSSKEKMFEIHRELGPAQGVGYGWFISYRPFAQDTLRTIGHGGGINGFNTLITRIPEDKNFIVLLNNTGGKDLEKITESIAKILYNEDYEMPKKSLAYELMDQFSKDGLAAAKNSYTKLKDDKNYELKELEMNSAAYELLRSDQTEAAIYFFKLNVQEFPNSGNVYDSLGEAYLKDGKKELALENYKRSLELDPSNTNAKEMIAKIEE